MGLSPLPADFNDLDICGAALALAAAGYFVFPVKGLTAWGLDVPEEVWKKEWKKPYRGLQWAEASTRDSKQITAWFAGTNGLAIGVDCGKSGLLVLDEDHPGVLPPGLLTPTLVNITGREGGGGHYIYQQPPRRTIGCPVKTGLPAGFGEVKGNGGYIVMAPSPHPSGRKYQLADPTVVPAVLPPAVAELLPDRDVTRAAVPGDEVEAFLETHVGDDHPDLLDVVLRSARDKVSAGASRHATLVEAGCWAMREALAGCYPARRAVDELGRWFAEAIGNERDITAEAPEVIAWCIGQTVGLDPVQVRAEIEARVAHARNPPWVDGFARNEPGSSPGPDPTSDGEASSGEDTQARPSAAASTPGRLPDAFWEARDELRHVRTAARSRMVGPDAVLGAVLTHVAMLTDYRILLPAIVGREGSLNLDVLLMARPGGGKGSAIDVAAALLPVKPATADHRVQTVPAGSGEGMVQSFFEKYHEKVEGSRTPLTKLRRAYEGLLIRVDEGRLLGALGKREGQTTTPTLLSAWSGEAVGGSYASDEKKARMEAHTYRLAVIMGLQPELGGWLLSEAAGGLPQRFIWLGDGDPEAPELLPDWPGPLTTPSGQPWRPPRWNADRTRLGSLAMVERRFVGVPQVVVEEIRAARRAYLKREDGDAEAGHDNLQRLKVASYLAILNGRIDIDIEDWKLAGMVMDVSAHLRERMRSSVNRAGEQKAQASAMRSARANAQVRSHEAQVVRVAKVAARHVHSHHADAAEPCRRRCVRDSIGRDRERLADALQYALDAGWITESEDGRYVPAEEVAA